MVSFDLIGDSIERNRKVISHHKTKQKRESNTHKNAEERLGETKKLFRAQEICAAHVVFSVGAR